jgi:uncharacterized protein YacL
MSSEFFFRIIGMVVFSISGAYWGLNLSRYTGAPSDLYASVMGLLGALVGLILTPFFTTRPVRAIRTVLGNASANTLFSSLTGLIIGLIIAALLSIPLSLLPNPLNQILPFLGAIVCGYLGVAVFVSRQQDIRTLMSTVFPSRKEDSVLLPEPEEEKVLLDTSVIIDGRIADIARTGFLPGTLLIPRFVLNELQYIADSSEPLRRQRGRRGLDVLTDMQKDSTVSVEISDLDVEGNHPVDDKLVLLARRLNYPVLTNDYNLNRVADIQGVQILNINELANAVKAVYLPGEQLTVEIIQEGKEFGQGVGYLDDGTMIVVEYGSQHLGSRIETVVTKVLQTAAGRMIFARPENGNSSQE